MKKFDWTEIDDYLFVKIVGELLARLGFVDIEYQGEGPDGGIDLFATELLPYTVQGRVPFRWAVQCKFSVNGTAVSVNDSEIKDVEGILTSERYALQDPRGYLVTNRKIVQNVVERLRGIDRRSRFRAARIDGSHLETLLADQPRLIEKIIGARELIPHGLHHPDLVVLPRDGSGTSKIRRVQVEIKAPGEETASVKIGAIVDTGASTTCIPLRVLNTLNLSPVGRVEITSMSHRQMAGLYLVEIAIERLGVFSQQVIGIDFDEVLLGGDFLSKVSVVFFGDGGMSFYRK